MTEIKLAKDMSPTEYAAKLAELRRGPPMAPLPLPEKHARDMSPEERDAWMAQHRRKHQKRSTEINVKTFKQFWKQTSLRNRPRREPGRCRRAETSRSRP
jgi:hypothetical protein